MWGFKSIGSFALLTDCVRQLQVLGYSRIFQFMRTYPLSCSAPPPTPAPKPRVPVLCPAPMQLSSSYQGEDLLAPHSRSLLLGSPVPIANSWNNRSHQVEGAQRQETILSVLKNEDRDEDSDMDTRGRYRGPGSVHDAEDLEEELQFTLSLS
jgi:hypothetical protein